MRFGVRFGTWVLVALMLVFGVGGAQAQSPGPGASADSPVAGALPPTACPPGTVLASGSIATIAGTGESGSSGDGGLATAATLSPSYDMLAVDPTGAVLFSDGATIRRIGTDGVISTFAGQATGAPFRNPTGLAFDSSGDLYVADVAASRIWMIDPAGAISPVAGDGESGSDGNGGPATAAQVQAAQIAVGPRGDLYFDDSNSYRTIDAAGVIAAFAGTGTLGFTGDGGPATEATLAQDVLGVAVGPDGTVYVGDPENHRIRGVDPSGIISTVAGTGKRGSQGDDGPAIDAEIEHPISIAVDPEGDVYFADWGTNTIRRIDTTGTITTVAGTGSPGSSGDCGPAVAAQLHQPYGLAIHDGVLFVGDEGNHRIRMILR